MLVFTSTRATPAIPIGRAGNSADMDVTPTSAGFSSQHCGQHSALPSNAGTAGADEPAHTKDLGRQRTYWLAAKDACALRMDTKGYAHAVERLRAVTHAILAGA